MKARLRRWFPVEELVACAIAFIVSTALMGMFTVVLVWVVG